MSKLESMITISFVKRQNGYTIHVPNRSYVAADQKEARDIAKKELQRALDDFFARVLDEELKAAFDRQLNAEKAPRSGSLFGWFFK